jgi:hypothetical protein
VCNDEEGRGQSFPFLIFENLNSAQIEDNEGKKHMIPYQSL